MKSLSMLLWLFLSACGATHVHTRSSSDSGVGASALAPAVAKVMAAPQRTWTWIDVPGAICGDGNQTGFAISVDSNSTQLMIMYQGGGACWDNTSCYILNAASNMSADVNAQTFARGDEIFVEKTLFTTNRDDALNPFRNVNLAFIPYCTGDLHDGNAVITYPGASHPSFHKGAVNAALDTEVLARALPKINHVWVSGYSAGGFGAILNYENTQSFFSKSRVDLIADSSESVAGLVEHSSWHAQVPAMLPGLNANNFSTLIPAFAKANPQSRFAAVSYAQDTVLPVFESLSQQAFADQIVQDFAAIRAAPNAQTFTAPGAGHVVLVNPQATAAGLSLAQFLSLMVTDDASWHSVP